MKENDNSKVPKEIDFNSEEFINKFVERVEYKDIKEAVKQCKYDTINHGFIRKKIMMALTYLGSDKFHDKLKNHKPYKHFMRDKDFHNISRNEIHYLSLLNPIAEKIYSTK